MRDHLAAPLEIKSLGPAESGEFSGYASIWHVTDLVGDKVIPGSFAASIAERKSRGQPLPMHFNHGRPEIGGVRAVGVWKNVAEDDKGLLVEGKIAGMGTEAGRLLYEKVRDGAVPGLSIGYSVPRDGVTYGREAGQPRRTLSRLNLVEISLTDDPANPYAQVASIKSAVLAGELPTERELEGFLRDAAGFSRSQAEWIVTHGFKSLAARRDGAAGDSTNDDAQAGAAARELRGVLSAFSLPSLR